jgi:hypothetical protein
VYTHRSKPAAPAAGIGCQLAKQLAAHKHRGLGEFGPTQTPYFYGGFRTCCSALSVPYRRRELLPLSWLLRRTRLAARVLGTLGVVSRHVFFWEVKCRKDLENG